MLCPSCDQKRALLYAEYLAEDLLLDLPHRQFVFTIPKILRPYFKSDKRLFGEVSRLLFSLLSEFFSLAAGQELLCTCFVSYQSFGEFARFHPHWHVLVLEGLQRSYVGVEPKSYILNIKQQAIDVLGTRWIDRFPSVTVEAVHHYACFSIPLVLNILSICNEGPHAMLGGKEVGNVQVFAKKGLRGLES